MDLTIVIPARQEEFLARTIADVLQHIRGNTEIIAVLDGAWASPSIPQDPRVQVVYLPHPIGQRAATNLGARLSRARYVMKLDAHCAVAEGFDVELITTGDALGHDVTQIPAQYNLHGFDWVCACGGAREYQGPEPQGPCPKCEWVGRWKREIVWKPRGKAGKRGTRYLTEFWRFDSQLHFQYWNSYKTRPEGQGEVCDVLTSLGACFFMRRERFWELGGMDDAGHGSWGQFGVEVALKSWLSGGRHVVNRRTWFSHLFRTQVGFGFPYPWSGKQAERARAYSRDMWLQNRWPGQVKPLKWLLEKFAPVPDWTEEQIAALPSELTSVRDSGTTGVGRMDSVRASQSDTDRAPSEAVSVVLRQDMPSQAVGLAGIVAPFAAQEVGSVRDDPKVLGVAAGRVITDEVVQHSIDRQIANEPLVNHAMNQQRSTANTPDRDKAITFVPVSCPDPTSGGAIEVNGGGQTLERGWRESSEGHFADSDHRPIISGISLRSGIVYYSDCLADPVVLAACRQTIEASGLPIVAVTLRSIDWPAVRNIVLSFERGTLTMFRQILAGLEASTAEVIFFCEHDCGYHPSHFAFTPPDPAKVYYNQHVWKVDAQSGRALHYRCSQTSGLCAYRDVLLAHYRKRVQMVEAHGFSRRMGFEPGTHTRPERVDDLKSETWMSPFPNVDIRHGHNLTPSRWTREDFRNQKYCEGWTEADAIPGWGVTKGRFQEFLSEVGACALV